MAVALAASLCAMAARSLGSAISRTRPRSRRRRCRSATRSRRCSVTTMPAATSRSSPSPGHRSSPIPTGRRRRRCRLDRRPCRRPATVPMATVRAGTRVARLASRSAHEGNPNLRGDAVVAAFLAGAGARRRRGAGPHQSGRRLPATDDSTRFGHCSTRPPRWVERARRAAAHPSPALRGAWPCLGGREPRPRRSRSRPAGCRCGTEHRRRRSTSRSSRCLRDRSAARSAPPWSEIEPGPNRTRCAAGRVR